MLSLRSVMSVAVVLLVGAAVLVGCSGRNAPGPAGDGQASDTWKAGLDENVVTSLSKLSDADRNAALAQKTCPVTGKPLGSMGAPPKVTVQGHAVFLCCAGCNDAMTSDPDTYLNKLEDTP